LALYGSGLTRQDGPRPIDNASSPQPGAIKCGSDSITLNAGRSVVADNVQAKVQIASGYGSSSMSPTTSNYQPMEDKFTHKNLWLRQAYLTW